MQIAQPQLLLCATGSWRVQGGPSSPEVGFNRVDQHFRGAEVAKYRRITCMDELKASRNIGSDYWRHLAQ